MKTSVKRIALLEPSVASECVVTEMMGQIRVGCPFIAGFLERKGFSVRIFAEELVQFDSRLMDSISRNFDAVGLSLALNTLPRGLQVARALKSRKSTLPIIIGGPSASAYADKLLSSSDAVFKGRAEITFPCYFENLEKGEIENPIPGIIYKNKGNIVRIQGENPVADGPARYDLVEGLGPKTIREGLFGYRKPAVYSLFASTGCVRRCRFCKAEKSFIPRRPENVIQDLELLLSLHGNYGLARFMLVDDCLFADLQATKELLRRIASTIRGKNVSFSAQFHVTPTQDTEVMSLFRAAGFTSLAIGFETVSQESLNHERKGTSVEENDSAIEQCRKFGVVPYGYFVVGFDTDTEETVKSVFDYILRRKLVAQVLPVGIMNRDEDGNPTPEANRVLSDTSFGATVFVSHCPRLMRASRLQELINQGYRKISSLKRLKDFQTNYERTFLFGLNRCFTVWEPAMRAHVAHLKKIAD